MQELLFRETIKKHRMDGIMRDYGVVILGFSGGADSSCLLRLMADWCRENGVELHAAHINHMIRGEEADRDERFCRETCTQMNIPFHILVADVPEIAKERGQGIEEAARHVRYSFFDSIAAELTGRADGAAVITAHNAGDNLETVIFNMLRGAGARGLCGIDPVRDGRFLRPLIADSGEAIRLWCKENSVDYVTDATNRDTEYTRNHIRHNVVGEMKRICPDPERAVYRMTELLRRDEDYLCAAATEYVKKGETWVSRQRIAPLHPAVSSRVLRALYGNVKKDGSTLGEGHIRALTELICGDGRTAELSLPGKITARIEGDRVSFVSAQEQEAEDTIPTGKVFSYPSDGEIFENSLYRVTFSPDEHICHSNNHNNKENIYKLSIHTSLSFDKIKGELIIKYREAGDTYRFGGMTRKVKKLLSEKKLTRAERSLIPVLWDDDGIVWIPGFEPRDGMKYSGDGRSLRVFCERKEEM